ncbi:MAG TPA: SelB C-terminal domain-containing protein [Candidatus Sulfotelmatobacter sp.]|nr:SelB C-terminal domain-containing protein [Candidatus Sulfotelmatobacter sp.]
MNLAGIERQGLRRGMAVVPRDAMVPSTRLDCLLRVLPATETGVRHRSSLEFHTGTAEAIATVSLITEDELRPGHAGYAQLNLDRPIPVLPFDRFVLRRASLLATVGGGTVLDIAPRRHRRRDRDALAALERRQMGGSEAMVREELRKERLGIDAQTLRKRTGLIESALEAALSALDGSALRVGALWFARERWEELRTQAVTVVREFHVAEPLRQGIPREEWSNHLRLRSHATAVANALVEIGDLVEHGPFLALPDHQPALSKTENEAIDQALKLLAQRGIDAPSPEELASLGLNRDVMHLLAQQGRIVRLPGGITLAAETYTWAKNAVEQYLRAHQAATVAQLRDHLGATRRVVVPLLEQLDASGVTVRNGDTRRLRAPVLTQSRH